MSDSDAKPPDHTTANMPQRVVEMATRVLTYVGVETVGHQLKLPVGGDEGDGAVVLEARQTDTLVELDVFQLHRFTLPTWRKRERVRKS